jgi:hypothetical protein
MSTAIVVNPDRFHALRAALRTSPGEVSPASLRQKLKACGLDQSIARAPQRTMPRVKLDFRKLESVGAQLLWTNTLVRMVSGEKR